MWVYVEGFQMCRPLRPKDKKGLGSLRLRSQLITFEEPITSPTNPPFDIWALTHSPLIHNDKNQSFILVHSDIPFNLNTTIYLIIKGLDFNVFMYSFQLDHQYLPNNRDHFLKVFSLLLLQLVV